MGFFLVGLSCLFATSKDLLSKRLASRLDGTISTFASFAFALPFYLVVLAILCSLGQETLVFDGTFLTLVVARSVTDTFAEALKMHAFAHGDISLVSSFLALTPAILLLVAPLITGDSPSLVGIGGVLLVVIGSLLAVRPHSTPGWAKQKKGVLLALGSALFFALNGCFDRLAVQRGTPVYAGFAMTTLSALFLLPIALRRSDRGDLWRFRGEFTLRGFLEIAFMVPKLYAARLLQPSYLAATQRLTLLLTIVAGKVLFREADFGRRFAAGCLIALGVIVLACAQAG
jgi:drug/metabolite transporter (DMT)-like permease